MGNPAASGAQERRNSCRTTTRSGGFRSITTSACSKNFAWKAQSGLSWRTILNKRDNFRAAFHHFDFHQVAHFGEQDVERLLQDAGIIRHRGKIEATINNAQRAQEMVEQEGSLAAFFWRYEPSDTVAPQSQTTLPESIAMAKELKKRGWKFFGPTTAFAFMQAMGLLNDHSLHCITREQVEQARRQFQRPG